MKLNFKTLLIIGLLLIFNIITNVKINSASPTYTKDVAPIIYTKCTNCHRSGEIGPMPFTNFNEVKSYGQMIKFTTSNGYMPPWSPNHNYSSFLGERKLSKEEINIIKEWVDAEMPQGDPKDEPNLPNFPDGSQLGKPDLTLKMSEKFLHKGNNQDQYQIFVLPVNLPEHKKIKAIEFRPDNKKIVHHAILAIDTTYEAYALDAQDSRYGYEEFGGFGFEPLENTWAGWAPGSSARFYPADIGKMLYKRSVVLAQIHYAPSPIDQLDQSEINIFYDTDNAVKRNMQTSPITPNDLSENFRVPAGQVKTFTGKLNVPIDVTLVSILPHMHLTGKSWEVFAIKPNKDTINIIKIDKWDFNWQDFYYLNKLTKIPANSVIYAKATYDNTAQNPNNPNSPPEDMYWGESTLDEMYICYFNYVPYNIGDENIDISTGVNINPAISRNIINEDIFPNPTNDFVNITLNLDNIDISKGTISEKEIDLNLYNKFGQNISKDNFDVNFTNNIVKISISDLISSVYYIKIKIRDEEKYLRFIKI